MKKLTTYFNQYSIKAATKLQQRWTAKTKKPLVLYILKMFVIFTIVSFVLSFKEINALMEHYDPIVLRNMIGNKLLSSLFFSALMLYVDKKNYEYLKKRMGN